MHYSSEFEAHASAAPSQIVASGAVGRSVLAAFVGLAASVAGAVAAPPSEFSSEYLDGKTFHVIEYAGEGERPVWSMQLSWSDSMFQFQDILPPGDPEGEAYVIDNGDVLIGGETRLILTGGNDLYLEVSIHEGSDDAIFTRWYLSEDDYQAELATVPFLPSAWIEVDGELDDWSDRSGALSGTGGSEGFDLLDALYAVDGENLYFAFEANGDVQEFLESAESGTFRTMYIEFNDRYEIGLNQFGLWFESDQGMLSFWDLGGDLIVDGNRIEGRLPLEAITGDRPDFMHLSVEMIEDVSEDEIVHDELEGLFQLDASYPEGGVESFQIVKIAFHEQTSTGSPQLVSGTAYEVEASIETEAAAAVFDNTLEMPNGTVDYLDREDEWDTWWELIDGFSTQANMDVVFPNGTYTFQIETPGDLGTVAASLDLTGDQYPSPPHISNYAAAQEIDAANPFVLSWDAFAGAGADDFVFIEIVDGEDEETVFEREMMAVGTTSVEIPAGVFQPEREYKAWIVFAAVADTNTGALPGATGRAIYASETEISLKTTKASFVAGDWSFAAFYTPEEPSESAGASYDLVFEEWYEVEGPLFAHMDSEGNVSGDFAFQTRLASHGQLLFYNDPADPLPDGYGIVNQNNDFFISAWGQDIGFAVRTPETAQQSDFAGAWNFVELAAGTELTKTVFDSNLNSEITLVGHDTPIVQDGSQLLLDVHLSPTSVGSVSLNVDAAGNAGGETLVWQGGSLAFSGAEFPLFANAAADFAFGIGEGEGEQALVLGVKAPTNADTSWLVGHWRVASLDIGKPIHEYAGEALSNITLGWEIEGTLETITAEIAGGVSLAPDGVITDDGDTLFLNASGDVMITSREEEDEWVVEVWIKVKDEIGPTYQLTGAMSGPGEFEVYPGESVYPGSYFSYEYMAGEFAVVRVSEWDSPFLGWSGDLPEGQDESAEGLLLPMNDDRWITGHFAYDDGVPSGPGPWDPVTDSDGDGMSDMFETVLVGRDPNVPESGENPLKVGDTSFGPVFEVAVRDISELEVQYEYSLDLESWAPVPGEMIFYQTDYTEEGTLRRITAEWSGPEEKVFFRFAMKAPVTDELMVGAGAVQESAGDGLLQYYSFVGQAGETYAVTLCPETGSDNPFVHPDLLVFESLEQLNAYWSVVGASGGEESAAAEAARFGRSANSGRMDDTLVFTPSQTGEFFLVVTGPDFQMANYSLQVWPVATPVGTDFEVELKDGQTIESVTLAGGEPFAPESLVGSYTGSVTIYEDGVAENIDISFTLNTDGSGTMFWSEDDEPELTWSVQNGSLVLIERTASDNDAWVWVFTTLASGDTLVQVRSPSGQEDSADFAVIGSLERVE